MKSERKQEKTKNKNNVTNYGANNEALTPTIFHLMNGMIDSK